ncbi:MAG: hypothetical protein AAB588_04415 [Patescibacteria group bacterium]
MRSLRETFRKIGDTALAVTLAGAIVANIAEAVRAAATSRAEIRQADQRGCEQTLANVAFVGYTDAEELKSAQEETCKAARAYIR